MSDDQNHVEFMSPMLWELMRKTGGVLEAEQRHEDVCEGARVLVTTLTVRARARCTTALVAL